MRILICMSLMISFFQVTPINAQNEYESYCVLSMNDNTILDSYQSENTQSVASISKVMSAMIAIENGELNKKVKVSDIINQVDGSMLYLQKSDLYTLEDLIYGLMLRSGNDAAVLIAESVGETVDNFVLKMNEKAKELHMDSTLFRNPSGLDEADGGNTSSTCDMAQLMSYAMKNDTFRKIVGTQKYIPRKGVLWINKNKFLKDYAYATGGKTGYTKNSKRTLITTSKKDEMEIVVVTFRVSDDFIVHKEMHEYAYQKFETVKLIDKGNYKINNKHYKIEQPLYQTIKRGDKNKIKMMFKDKKNRLCVNVIYDNLKKEFEYINE